jgi:hypothetical protein
MCVVEKGKATAGGMWLGRYYTISAMIDLELW